MKIAAACGLSLVCALNFSAFADANDHQAILSYLTDDVVAVAYLDLTAFDATAIVSEAKKLGVPATAVELLSEQIESLERYRQQLTAKGARRCYVLARLADIHHAGPSWVIPLEETAAPIELMDLLKQLRAAAGEQVKFLPNEFRLVRGAMLAARTRTQLDEIASQPSTTPREEMNAALSTLGGAAAGLMIVGDEDSRRVLREVFPQLPKPFETIDGSLIADHVSWGVVAIGLPPKLQIKLHVQATDDQVAESLNQSAIAAVGYAKTTIREMSTSQQETEITRIMVRLLDALKPHVNGTSVQIVLDDELPSLLDLFVTPTVVAARSSAQRAQRINQFKQVALAFWNYESANGSFVRQANYDDQGRPLLSWRVHLLPYLEQQELYEKFHLDESWDSPHNRQLIQQMPTTFADPDGARQRAIGSGRTTILAPVSKKTMFLPHAADPLRVRDVKDGTSKTILLVDAPADQAVVWTQPVDWMVNLDTAMAAMKDERPGFVAAFCDGHVRFLSNDLDPEVFRFLLTRAGGEATP